MRSFRSTRNTSDSSKRWATEAAKRIVGANSVADVTTKTEPGGEAPLLRVIGLAIYAACAVLTILFLVEVAGAMSVRVTDTLVHDRLGGSVIDHSIRIRQGLPLYAEPDDHFVPLVYTPIYYYLAAGSMSDQGNPDDQ